MLLSCPVLSLPHHNCHSVFLLNDHTVVHTQVLEVDDNAIESLEGLYHLPKLEEVSLRNNRILFSKKSRCFIRNPFSGVGAGAWFDSVFFINKQIQTCSRAKFCYTHLFQTEMLCCSLASVWQCLFLSSVF